MSTVVADLHVHSSRSDGAVAPAEVPEIARRVGLEAVAITDHDRLPPLEAPVVSRGDVEVVGGIELRVEAGDVGRVDLLGLGVTPTGPLEGEIERIQTDRMRRALAMRDRLADTLDVDLDVPIGPGVGRPHLAAAVAERTDLDVAAVFERYIGEDGPCYVAREVPSFDRGRELLGAACEVVVLAHPLRYDDPEGALERCGELDGFEAEYPYDADVDRTPLERARERPHAVETGGSDAHTADAIGTVGLGRGAYDAVRPHLGTTD